VLIPAKQYALEDESDGTYLSIQPSSSKKRDFILVRSAQNLLMLQAFARLKNQ
jgi:hypothetical protein